MTRSPLARLLVRGSVLALLGIISVPVQVAVAEAECFDPASVGAGAKGGAERAADHRDISAKQQKAIDKRTKEILANKTPAQVAAAANSKASIPTYFHVMLSASGAGDVTQQQIDDQMAVLNLTFGGGESAAASNTGVGFTLAGVDRYRNNSWHTDKQSNTYRAKTRLGGANALNIWLVDFKNLGIATFPSDYSRNASIDGIRVHYDSLPGGNIANFNLGETATHEAGHWMGLYHTFQGGCTATNDQVADTPAQSSPTSGCPAGRDSCSLPGLDPIHNYMDYSYDTCYTEFTPGQTARMDAQWTAYRG